MKHYIKYLGIVLTFLFLFLVSSSFFQSRPDVLLSPSDSYGGAAIGNNFLNFYVNFSPLISGILVVIAIALLVVIVASYRYR